MAERFAEILRFASGHRTLEDVTRWALLSKPPHVFADARVALRGDVEMRATKTMGFDLVIQDEYTHDVVVPYSSDVFLVYDTT